MYKTPRNMHLEKFCNVSTLNTPTSQNNVVDVSNAKWELIFLSLSAICQMSLSKSRRNSSFPFKMEYTDVDPNIRKSDILEKILESYDTSLRPIGKSGAGPVEVDVNVRVRSIENINDVKMEYTVQMVYRQTWLDRRLSYDHIPNNFKFIQVVDPKRIWTPDIFFSNEITGYLHKLMIPNIYTRILPNGQVLTSSRITLLLACQMELEVGVDQLGPLQYSDFSNLGEHGNLIHSCIENFYKLFDQKTSCGEAEVTVGSPMFPGLKNIFFLRFLEKYCSGNWRDNQNKTHIPFSAISKEVFWSKSLYKFSTHECMGSTCSPRFERFRNGPNWSTQTLKIQFEFQLYPLDKQSCAIVMGSYGWATKDLILGWGGWNAVEIDRGINMPSFKLMSYANETCANSVTSSGSYSCINLRFEFERQFGYFLIQVYIPCCMVVAVSWLSFWLGPTAADARISLCVTTILTVVTATYGLNQSVPPASYIKAIDVWTFAIQFMVFASIIQFAYVNYVVNFQWKKALKTMKVSNDDAEDREEILKHQGELKAKRIDSISKVLFPGGFAIFNLIYWTVYLSASSADRNANMIYEV